MWLLRKVILYVQRFFAFMFWITAIASFFDWDNAGAFIGITLMVLVDLYDFKLIKNKIFSHTPNQNNNFIQEKVILVNDIDTKETISTEYTEYEVEVHEKEIQDEVYMDDDFDEYRILKCETWETLNTDIEYKFFQKWEKNRQRIYDIYWELSVEHEEIKQFWDDSKMIDFETKVHKYFSEEVLTSAFRKGFIHTTNPVKWKLEYINWPNKLYELHWKTIKKKQFQDIKKVYEKKMKYFKNQANQYIYDLYAKSLRRIGNSYKKNKLWKEAIGIFNIIEDMWQAGVMDKKNIIKIRKELD